MEAISGPESDRTLVKCCRDAGREESAQAFRGLYDRHAGPLCSYLRRMTQSPHLADDLTQEAFLRAYSALGRFEGNSSFKTWLFRIATNLYKDQLRRKRPVVNGETVANAQSINDPSPVEVAERKEEAQRVHQAVQALPDQLRGPVVLVRLEGMKYREAADVLGITLEALRMRIHRAHMALVAALTE